jgi:hypothetical protein
LETTLHSPADNLAVIAWIFLIIGALALCFALFFLLIIRYSFFKGMAFVLLTSAMLQLSLGIYTLAAHEDKCGFEKQISDVSSFTWIAVSTLLIGILLFSTFFRSAQTFWKGIGLGMIIQGALSVALLRAEAEELKRCKATVTQYVAFQTKCRKKIDDRRNWYGDFS